MTKNDVINNVSFKLLERMDSISVEIVKATLTVELSGFELVSAERLPSTEVKDNDFIMRRFLIDKIAKGTKESSIKAYLNTIKKFFTETNINYMSVTARDITDYLAVKRVTKNTRGEYPSQNTLCNMCKAFFIFFQWAYKKRHIDEDVMRDVDRIPEKLKKKEKLTDEEIENVRNACKDDRELALFELMISTGMRVGEISQLKIENINFADRTVEIYAEKTDSYRTGVLSIKARNAIWRYLGDRRAGFVFNGTRKCDAGKRLCNGSIESIAKEIGFRSGAHCKTCVHVYRKTFASVLFKKKRDVKMVSVMLGHANTAVTEKYYLIDDMEDLLYQVKSAA